MYSGNLLSTQCVQWHVNCNYLATGSSDKTVRLWDVQSGECVRIFIGHRSMVLSLAMSPDGRYMASGDEDGIIMLWDLSSGRCVSPLTGHSSCVWTLAFRLVIYVLFFSCFPSIMFCLNFFRARWSFLASASLIHCPPLILHDTVGVDIWGMAWLRLC